jgi:hypothetical protein
MIVGFDHDDTRSSGRIRFPQRRAPSRPPASSSRSSTLYQRLEREGRIQPCDQSTVQARQRDLNTATDRPPGSASRIPWMIRALYSYDHYHEGSSAPWMSSGRSARRRANQQDRRAGSWQWRRRSFVLLLARPGAQAILRADPLAGDAPAPHDAEARWRFRTWWSTSTSASPSTAPRLHQRRTPVAVRRPTPRTPSRSEEGREHPPSFAGSPWTLSSHQRRPRGWTRTPRSLEAGSGTKSLRRTRFSQYRNERCRPGGIGATRAVVDGHRPLGSFPDHWPRSHQPSPFAATPPYVKIRSTPVCTATSYVNRIDCPACVA